MVFHFDHLTIDYGPEGKYDPVPMTLFALNQFLVNGMQL